jgi:hypothetical protein
VIDDGHEEIESIPWSELARATSPGRRRTMYLAAGAIAFLAIGVVLARTLSSRPSVVVSPASATTAVPMEAPDTTVASAVLYEEADLLAVAPDDGVRAAVARAEWFVTDYFTADLEPNGTADLRSALPSGTDLPDMPQDGAVGLSYVEWARAYRVEEAVPGRYRVHVVFRLLGAPQDEGFRRLTARAVSVLIEVNALGGSVVLDLPTPSALPAGPEVALWPEYSAGNPPIDVIEGAMALMSGFGSEHRLLGASPLGEGWRVVATATDEVGNRWPLSVRVDDRGLPLD